MKLETRFGDMKLWIIQDDDYSTLRNVKGCEDFCDLPATRTDAVEIQKLATMLGIPDENIRQFHSSTKKDLNRYYNELKKEYNKLMKKEDDVFLLVYCSGHGVTSSCKQVYVLDKDKDATFNIEQKLRMMADKFENFLHIFAIYDVCQSDLSNMPELLAVRGRQELPGHSSDSSDTGNFSETATVPYFHISAARPGGTAAADAGFAAKCLKFALKEAKRDVSKQNLIEFPRAWSRKFRQV